MIESQEDQIQLQTTAREFAQKEMTEVAKEIEHTGNPLSDEWFKGGDLTGH